jgi:hypothetical protein
MFVAALVQEAARARAERDGVARRDGRDGAARARPGRARVTAARS